VQWYADRAGLAVVKRDGKIAAVGLARPVESPRAALDDSYHWNEDAPFMWCEASASIDPAAFHAVVQIGLLRFNKTALMLYQRRWPNEGIRVIPRDRANKVFAGRN
jgi:hypothetical protein